MKKSLLVIFVQVRYTEYSNHKINNYQVFFPRSKYRRCASFLNIIIIINIILNLSLYIMSKNSPLVEFLSLLQDKIFYSLTPQQRIIPFRYVINTFKGLTIFWVIFLMNYFQNFSTGMYLYLALHGSYGIFWVIKDIVFPDARFMAKASIGSCLLCFIFLTGYWLIPVPLAAGYGINNPSSERIIFLIILYVAGLILMLGSDYQKYVTLKVKKGLISSGFFKYSRNPNYLGQIFIYSSFVLCAGNIVGFIDFYGLACIMFAMNIYLKDKVSYQKKQGWEQYRKQSYILLPKIFKTFALNFAFYSGISIAIISFLHKETPATFLYPISQ